MAETARVRARLDGRVATLELTGRGDANAMDLQFVRELDESVADITAAADAGTVDVLVLHAVGGNFCVGGDVAEFAAVADLASHVGEMLRHANRAVQRLHELDIPVVARWQGAAAGGGIGLILAADLVVADPTATLTGGYSAVGLSPDAGVSWALPRRVGSARARDILLTNRRVEIEELVALGIVSRTADAEGLDAAVARAVEQLLRVPGDAARAAKRLTRIVGADDLASHLSLESESMATLAAGAHVEAAIDRFRASRAKAGQPGSVAR